MSPASGRPYNARMPDVLYLVLTVAFFAGCAGFVKLCDRIVGPDSEHGDLQGAGEADPEPADLEPVGGAS